MYVDTPYILYGKLDWKGNQWISKIEIYDSEMPEGQRENYQNAERSKIKSEYQDPMLAVLVFNKQYFILVDDNHNI